jgi:hypothetical protein
MPSCEGAAAVAVKLLPANTSRIIDTGSSDSTDELPAISGNTRS